MWVLCVFRLRTENIFENKAKVCFRSHLVISSSWFFPCSTIIFNFNFMTSSDQKLLKRKFCRTFQLSFDSEVFVYEKEAWKKWSLYWRPPLSIIWTWTVILCHSFHLLQLEDFKSYLWLRHLRSFNLEHHWKTYQVDFSDITLILVTIKNSNKTALKEASESRIM